MLTIRAASAGPAGRAPIAGQRQARALALRNEVSEGWKGLGGDGKLPVEV